MEKGYKREDKHALHWTPWLTHRNVPSSSEAQGKPSQSVYVSNCLVSGKVSLKGLSPGLSVDVPAECLV